MKIKLLIVNSFTYFFLLIINSANSSQITVNMKDGTVLNGELIFVNDNSFIITTLNESVEMTTLDSIADKPDIGNLIEITNFDVINIVIKGKSYTWCGAITGEIVGLTSLLLIGRYIKFDVGTESFIPILLIAAPLLGPLVGVIVSHYLSTDDIVIKPTQDLKFKLKPYAKYQNEKPEFLKYRTKYKK